MMKKSFLTPVLSGVLALTVVGSGAAYYFEFVKDSGDGKAKTADESSQSGAVTIDEAAKNKPSSIRLSSSQRASTTALTPHR